MTDAEHAQLVEQERDGKIIVGVDRAAARQFFSGASVSNVHEVTGYAPHIEESVFHVRFHVWAAPSNHKHRFCISRLWLVGRNRAYACPLLYFGYQAASSVGSSGAGLISAFLVVAVGLYIFGPFSVAPLMRSVVLFVFSLWCVRMVYVSSTHFYRAMALQNAKLFNLLSAGIELRQVG